MSQELEFPEQLLARLDAAFGRFLEVIHDALDGPVVCLEQVDRVHCLSARPRTASHPRTARGARTAAS
jgi:hypothetical protein